MTSRGDLDLHMGQLGDPVVQENFDRIQQFVESDLFLTFQGRLVRAELSGAGDWFVAHGLGYVPTDAIVTANPTNADVYIKTDEFDSERMVINVNQECTLRILVGSFRENLA